MNGAPGTTPIQASASEIEVLDFDTVMQRLKARNWPHQQSYLSFYSSWIGGIVHNPFLMQVPVDDHMVHRGDGVFEALRFHRRQLYGLDRHLDRLENSASLIGLKLPLTRVQLTSAIIQTARAARTDHGVVRLYVSRGPGGFSADPYESIGSQVYIVVTGFKPLPDEVYERGCRAGSSSIGVKPDFFPNVKSCNYLPNALMKKEAVDSGLDFVVSWDEEGHLAEGATENVLVVTAESQLVAPSFQRTLRGTTLIRALELARTYLSTNLADIRQDSISQNQVRDARELMIAGTTLDVIPIIEFDGKPVGEGRPGPIFKKLLGLLREDLESGPGQLLSID